MTVDARGRSRTRLSGAAVAAGCALAITPAPAAADQVRLTIEGARTLTVTGGCTVETAAGEKTLAVDTAPPFAEGFTAEGLSCRFTAAGTGSATLTIEGPGGNRSVTTLVPGGTALVTVR